MAKKKQSEEDCRNDSNSGQDNESLNSCPLTMAVLNDDTETLGQILEQSLPMGAIVGSIVLEQSCRESFTSGQSTPVYLLQAHVQRNGSSHHWRFVIKLVTIMEENDRTLHLRESYAVERRFYETVAKSCHQYLTAPNLLYSDLDGSKAWPIFCILMNDVSVTFPEHLLALSLDQAMAALKWLATFHAIFWNSHQKQLQQQWRLWP